jgi:hypothetical protein
MVADAHLTWQGLSDAVTRSVPRSFPGKLTLWKPTWPINRADDIGRSLLVSAANKFQAFTNATVSKFLDLFPRCPALMAAYPESSPTLTSVHNFRCDVILSDDGRAVGRRCGFCFRNATMDDGESGAGLPGLIQFKIFLPVDSNAVEHAEQPLTTKHTPALSLVLEADFLKHIYGQFSIPIVDGLIPIPFLDFTLPAVGSLFLALEFKLVQEGGGLGLTGRINACANIKIVRKGTQCLTNGIPYIPFLHVMLPISDGAQSAIAASLSDHVDKPHLDHSEALQNRNLRASHADDVTLGSGGSEAADETGTIKLSDSALKLTAQEKDAVGLLCDKNEDGALSSGEFHACFDSIIVAASSAEPNENEPPAAPAVGGGEL